MESQSFHPIPPVREPKSCPSALAPMQDVTTLPFMKIMDKYGAPDYFFTEYFRVHEHSTLEKHILSSITEHPTDRPVYAQLIGEDEFHLQRMIGLLEEYPIAGIDLNMGCPAPKVYRKNVGGGLLRDPQKIDSVLATLRQRCTGSFSVKMRIGFEDDVYFDEILEIIAKHRVDFVSIHGRTVKQMYRGAVSYPHISKAAARLEQPVFANGNITSAAKALQIQKDCHCFGAMIGRSAIRNPWIFRQIRELSLGQTLFQPTLSDVHQYIRDLCEHLLIDEMPERVKIGLLKKFLAFIGQSVDPEGKFLYEVRRTRSLAQLEQSCVTHLSCPEKADLPYSLEPYPDVVARPNHEDKASISG